MKYHVPARLRAAELDLYTRTYGANVRAMDLEVAATSAPSDLIDLTHGDTRAFWPPMRARDDFFDAVSENTEAYSAYRGSASVREVLAPRLAALLDRAVDPRRDVVLTPGTQGGLYTALGALVNVGDVVAVPSVEYFMDERILAYQGANVVRVPLRRSDDGTLHLDEMDLISASSAGAKGLVLSNPNNPTGGVYSREALEVIARWARRHDAWVLVDQLYCRLVFDERRFVHLSALEEMAERTVTLVGPSKTESMSGYRVGAAVAPPVIVDAMEQLISMNSLRTAGYAQHTLRHWMDNDHEWLAERTRLHQLVRDQLVARLRAIDGVRVTIPAGSSYVFPDTANTPWAHQHGADDFALAKELKAAGVLVSPGYQFGLEGRGHFRINFSQDLERLLRAVDRMAQVLLQA